MTDDALDPPPDVLEALWDREQVDALFADLELAAAIRHVQVRHKSGRHQPTDAAVTLPRAHQLLKDGLVTAIQIYYDFESQTWCDTLIVLENTYRIVRTTVPAFDRPDECH